MAIRRASKTWTRPAPNRKEALSRFAIMFEDRRPSREKVVDTLEVSANTVLIRRCYAIASVSPSAPNFTDTIFDTPAFSIVTP